MMKVKFEDSITFKVLDRISRLSGDIVIRSDLTDLADPRQISRALGRLVKRGDLAKIGYGVYAKLDRSTLTQTTYLNKGALSTFRSALDRLNIRWQPSSYELDYNSGLSTQVPVNPGTKIIDRFRRKLSYKNMELKRE